MPKYKLVYFDIRARGEIIRLLFAVAGVPYEDYRIPMNGLTPAPEWEGIKKKSPFGQLPMLEVDGEELAQSHAIERFLAREFGLAGDTNLEQAKVDMWIEAADEIIRRLSDNIEIEDRKIQAEDRKHITTINIPLVLTTLDKALAGSKSGFIVGNKLTVADLAFFSVRDWMKSVLGEETTAILAQYKNVSSHLDRISNVPAIADWLKKRPDGKF